MLQNVKPFSEEMHILLHAPFLLFSKSFFMLAAGFLNTIYNRFARDSTSHTFHRELSCSTYSTAE